MTIIYNKATNVEQKNYYNIQSDDEKLNQIVSITILPPQVNT